MCLASATVGFVQLRVLSWVWAVPMLVLGLGFLRGVRALTGPRSVRIVPELLARERNIDYVDIVRVRLLGAPSSRGRIAWAPGLHLRIELSSADDIVLRAAPLPWATRGQQAALRKLYEELIAVSRARTCERGRLKAQDPHLPGTVT
jgi:hypothetical protein